MEELVIALERAVVVAGRSLLLHVDQVADPLPALRGEGLASLPHDRDLHRLAHEAGLHHLPDRKLDHDRPALRLDVDEARTGQRDQGLADRLAGDPVFQRDLLLRQARARRQLERDDGAPQLGFDAAGRRSAGGRGG